MQKQPLEQVMRHDGLYSAFPDTATIPTRMNVRGTANASYSARDEWPPIGETKYNRRSDISVGDGGNNSFPDTKSSLLHESQHAIQNREGFAQGGSPSNFGQQKEAELARDARSWMRELARKKKTMPDADRIAVENSVVDEYSNMGAMDWLPSREARDLASEPYLKNPNDMKNLEELIELYGLNQKTTPSSDMDLYKRLAGEAEARNVQTRMDFTPQQRQAQPPWETLDVPENELLVRMLTGQ
jgi:hypothetical protein